MSIKLHTSPLIYEKYVKYKKCEVSNCNFLDSDSCVYDEIMQPILYSGYLYKTGSLNKGTLSRRTRDGRRKTSLGSDLGTKCTPSVKMKLFSTVSYTSNIKFTWYC